MIVAALCAVMTIAFVAVFIRLNIVTVARRALATTRLAVVQMRDPDLDDLQRERAVQSAGLSLAGSFLSILWRSCAALLAAMLLPVIADRIGLVPFAQSMAFLSRTDVILVSTGLAVLLWIGTARYWRG
jgi:hypothetical protein